MVWRCEAGSFAIRNASDSTMPCHEGADPIILRFGIADDLAHRRHVERLDAAAQRVRHQAAREAQEHDVLVAQQRVAQTVRALDRRCRRTAARRCRPVMPPSRMRHLPVASKFSSARPSGSITRWHDVHCGLLRCCSMRSRTVQRAAGIGRALRFFERGHVRRRRRRRRSEQHFHHPLAALHRRRALGDRRQRQDAAVAENAAAIGGQRDAPEFGAGDVRDAVVARDALVRVGVVGGKQIEQAAILANQAVEEQLGLLLQRQRQRLIGVRIQDRIRNHLLEVLQPQPLRREARGQGIGVRRRQHAARLLRQRARQRQPALPGEPSATRHRDRGPTGRTTGAMPARSRPGDSRPTGRRATAISSTRNRNCGLARIASSALVMPASKFFSLRPRA